jgi:hypothetical protein
LLESCRPAASATIHKNEKKQHRFSCLRHTKYSRIPVKKALLSGRTFACTAEQKASKNMVDSSIEKSQTLNSVNNSQSSANTATGGDKNISKPLNPVQIMPTKTSTLKIAFWKFKPSSVDNSSNGLTGEQCSVIHRIKTIGQKVHEQNCLSSQTFSGFTIAPIHLPLVII